MAETKQISLTQYHEKMGDIRFPDGFEAHLKKLVYEYDSDSVDNNDDGLLRGCIKESYVKSITQQMRCYGWSEYNKPVEWNDPRLVAEKPDPELQRKICPIMSGRDNIRLVTKENMVVGVALESAVAYYHSGEDYFYLKEDRCIFPYQGYIFSSTSDNNGAGYKQRDWYRYLVCLPYNHNLW